MANQEPNVRTLLGSFIADARVGMSFLTRNVTLRLLTISAMFSNSGLAVMSAVEAIYLLRVLDLSPTAFGLVVTVGASGGLLGSWLGPRAQSAGAQRAGAQRALVVTAANVQVVGALVLITAQWVPNGLAIIFVSVQSLSWGTAVVAGNSCNPGGALA
jgi:Na+/melibiose symporter-like transporter